MGHLGLLELINREGGSEGKSEPNIKGAKSPDVKVISRVRQIDIADAVLLVDRDVLPVAAGGALQLNVGQPSTWLGSKFWLGFARVSHRAPRLR